MGFFSSFNSCAKAHAAATSGVGKSWVQAVVVLGSRSRPETMLRTLGLEHVFSGFFLNFMIPFDEYIFQMGGETPPTSMDFPIQPIGVDFPFNPSIDMC